MPVQIVAVALLIDGLIISKPRPARHGDLIYPYADRTGYIVQPEEQGFLTSDGEFVDRKLAYTLAYLSGQLHAKNPGKIKPWFKLGEPGPDLFSEDIW